MTKEDEERNLFVSFIHFSSMSWCLQNWTGLFAAENIIDLEHANGLVDGLLPHANANEVHRELGVTPQVEQYG